LSCRTTDQKPGRRCGDRRSCGPGSSRRSWPDPMLQTPCSRAAASARRRARCRTTHGDIRSVDMSGTRS
jgi:hypothetical protein